MNDHIKEDYLIMRQKTVNENKPFVFIDPVYDSEMISYYKRYYLNKIKVDFAIPDYPENY